MDDLDLELELDKKRPVKVIKKGGLLGKFIALLLGFVIGVVACFGGIAAVVYYFVGVMKIEEGANYLKGVLGDDFDYTDYIDGDFGDKTALDLITSSMSAAQEVIGGTGSLNTLNEIYPFLYTLVAGAEDADPNAPFNGLAPLLQQYGLDVDADKMMSLIVNGSGGETLAPDTYLGDYLLDKVYSLAVGDLLQLTPMQLSPIIVTLFYGEEDVDYVVNEDGLKEPLEGGMPWITVGDLLFAETDVIGDRVESLPIASVMRNLNTSNKIMMTLAYGAKDHYTVKNGKVEMNQQVYTFDGAKFYNDDGEQLTHSWKKTEDGEYTLTFEDETLYLKEDSENAGNFLVYSDADCTKPVKYKKTTVGDLSGDTTKLLNRMELGDALNITAQSNDVLISLAYGTKDVDYKIVGTGNAAKIYPITKPRTLGDLYDGGDEIIEDIRLADVMEADADDAIMTYLFYGKKGIHYESDTSTMSQRYIVLVTDPESNVIVYNEYGDAKLKGTVNAEKTEYTENEITYTLTFDETANKIETPDGDGTVYLLSDANGAVLFTPTTLGKLMSDTSMISNLTGRLTLEEVMGKENLQDTPMKALGDTIIDELPDAIDTLQLKDIFAEEDLKNSKILNSLGESSLESLADDIDDLTFAAVFDYETEVKGNTVLEYLYHAKDPITDKEYPITQLTEAIDAMAVSDVFTEEEMNSNPILQSLAKDAGGKDVLIKDMSDRLNELTVADVFGDDMYKKDEDGNVLLDENDNQIPNPIIYTLKDTKINELGAKVNELTVGDIFGDEIYVKDGENFKKDETTTDPDDYLIRTDANHVLATLHDTKISELSSAMNTITVGDMFVHEIYLESTDGFHFQKDEDGNMIVDPDANPILVTLRDCPVNKMSGAVETLTVGEVFKAEIYEEDGTTVKGSWYYLLKETRDSVTYTNPAPTEEDPNATEKVTYYAGDIHTNYYISSEMNLMIDNMTANMKTASLKELHDNKIINLEKHKDTLLSDGDNGLINYIYDPINNVYKIDASDYGDKTHYHELTVEELFNYMGDLLETVT